MRTGRETPVYQCESDDEGKTWTKAYPLQWMYSRFGRSRPIVGTDPDLIEMQDGTLVMAFGHKPDYQEHGNYLAFSIDHGHSWTQVVPISSTVTRAYCGVREVSAGRAVCRVHHIGCEDCPGLQHSEIQHDGPQRSRYQIVECDLSYARCSLLCSCWRMAPVMTLVWTERKSMPRPEAGGAAGFLDGEFVIAGGTTWDGDTKLWLKDVQIYAAQAERMAIRTAAACAAGVRTLRPLRGRARNLRWD